MAGPSAYSNISSDRVALLVKVARLYHEDGHRQPQIAERLNISQSMVSRLLKEATEVGIVRTSVIAPPGAHADLEASVRDAYGLRDVVVVDDPGGDESLLLARLGGAGAVYLGITLSADEIVGLSSWSASLVATVNAMTPKTKPTARDVVQILGGVGDSSVQVEATHLADRFARVTGGRVHYVAAPGVVVSRDVRDALLADPNIAEVVDLWSRLTVAIVGIGSLEPSPLLRSSGNAVSAADQERLRTAGAVGDVCLNFYDADGQRVETDLHDRVVGIPSEQLLSTGRRVGIAGGERKFQTIRAALRGRWIDVLITDATTARRLVDEASDSRP